MHLVQDAAHVKAPVLGSVRGEALGRLLELALAPGPVAAARLIPGDRDVDQALEEVALVRVGSAPGILQRFVRGEELARADQVDPSLEARRRP